MGIHTDLEYAASTETSSKIGAKGATSTPTIDDRSNIHLLFHVASTRSKDWYWVSRGDNACQCWNNHQHHFHHHNNKHNRSEDGFCYKFNRYNRLSPRLSPFQSSPLMFKGRIVCNGIDQASWKGTFGGAGQRGRIQNGWDCLTVPSPIFTWHSQLLSQARWRIAHLQLILLGLLCCQNFQLK